MFLKIVYFLKHITLSVHKVYKDTWIQALFILASDIKMSTGICSGDVSVIN